METKLPALEVEPEYADYESFSYKTVSASVLAIEQKIIADMTKQLLESWEGCRQTKMFEENLEER